MVRVRWEPLDLTQDTVDSTLWTGTLPLASPAGLRFVVQAVNGLGLVTLDDALGSYHRVTSASTAPPKATTLELQSPPTSGVFGTSASVSAKLTENGTPLAGKTVLLSIGSAATLDVTNAAGEVSVTIPLSAAPGATVTRASFAGDETFEPSDDSAPFTVGKAPSSLSAFTAQAAVVTGGGETGVTTTLTANLGGKAAPLLQQTVTFTLTGPAAKTYSTITDYLGRATLPATGLAPGTYAVTARYAGDSTFTADTRTGTLVVSPFTGFLQPVDNPPTVNTVKAGSAVPIKFSLGGNRGLAILAPGSPVVTAVSCASGAPIDEIETTVATSSSALQYDAASNTYTYVWKTPKSFAGTCRKLDVRLVDGTSHVALFRLR